MAPEHVKQFQDAAGNEGAHNHALSAGRYAQKMRKLLDVNPFVRINLRIVSDEMPTIETNRNAILRRLGQEGWTLARHGGSHDLYAKPGADVLISVPRHKTLSPGTARSIAKSAGWI